MSTTSLIPPFAAPSPAKAPTLNEPKELRIPTNATTHDGFREWFASPEFPERIRASLIGDKLFIEHCFFGEVQALRIPTSATTLDGFREWFASPEFPERIRASLIGNELHIESSMEDLLTHNQVKTIVSAVLATLIDELKFGRFCNDGMLLEHAKAGVSTIPDALFASYASIESGRVRISTIGKGEALVEWQGSPDWVLEVVSASSEQKDKRDLFDGYFRAGIGEYWLIDARGESIEFRIFRAGVRGYESVVEEGGWLASPLFGRRFRLTRELDRVKMWLYRLEVRPMDEQSPR
jgi:Uma2 family endonuclease